MALTPANFRTNFPAFADALVYTDPEIQFWLDMSLLLLNAERWGDLLPFGQQLFTAHNISLEVQSQRASAGGGVPGEVIGPKTSASVDKVSWGRNPGAAMDPENGHWNLTTYGLRFIRYLRMMGAGPIHVGVPTGGENPDYYPGAWPGPY